MKRSEEINALAEALALAQGEITGAKKDSRNPHFNSTYADLASVWEACRAPLARHGLSVLQSPRLVMTDQVALVEIETTLLHTSGQWMADTLSVPMTKFDAQGEGSAITYGRRFALSAFVGVAPEDDDGNAAVSEPAPRGAAEAPPGALDTVVVKVLGIVKRTTKTGKEKYIVTGSDRATYGTFSLTEANTAKAAQEAGADLEITYKTTPYGRDIQALRELEPAPL